MGYYLSEFQETIQRNKKENDLDKRKPLSIVR